MLYTIHATGDGYLIKRWIEGDVGPRLLYTAHADTLQAARDLIPPTMTCREREHYDLPDWVESWCDKPTQ